jgi:hypothetical protein
LLRYCLHRWLETMDSDLEIGSHLDSAKSNRRRIRLVHALSGGPTKPRPEARVSLTRQQDDSATSRARFTPQECHHDFAIALLPRRSRFKGRAYLYTCLRCKWIFRVNDSSGWIIPIDSEGEELPEQISLERIRTFADGPCPSFSRIS